MNGRVWTVKELDRVLPLPEGWTWSIASGLSEFDPTRPWAFGVGDRGVEVDADGAVSAQDGNGRRFDPPAEVALAVILASQGRDSMEAMAEAMDGIARVIAASKVGQAAYDGAMECAAAATGRCAEILRRGRVKP